MTNALVGGIRLGDVLAGKYRVERVLGAGGMGVVVAAHHLQLDEKVALKFLLPQALLSPDAVARFLQEARAAVKVKSEHVARVVDVGQLENGSPYMVMEYLEGRDLAAWLDTEGAMGIERAVDFVLQACEALADAHSLGIVHRDLKPANLFCIQRSDGELSIKVLDFGISKVTIPGASGHDMTRTTSFLGSPLYMSPEQMRATKGVDARTDIWSLGVILFELLTGRRPFHAEGVTELAIKVASDPAPALRELRHDAPQGLADVVARCLEKDRTKRFQSVGQLAVALKDFGSKGARISVERVLGTLRGAGVSEAVLPPAGEANVSERPARADAENAPRTAASWGQTAAGTTSGRNTAVGIGLVLFLGVAISSLLLLRTPPAGASGGPLGTATSSALAGPPNSVSSAASMPVLVAVSASVGPDASATSTTASSSSAAQGAPEPSVPPHPVSPAATSPAPQPRPAALHPSPHPPAPQPPARSASSSLAASLPLPSPPPSPAAKPNCDPPYTIDSSGHREYKRECLN